MQNPNSALRGEAERHLFTAEKLLQSRDLVGARDFAILAQENDPLLEGSDQILAIAEVLISSEKRVNQKHHDWYSILQVDRRSDDFDLIKKQYRRLALLLHPDKNRFPFADHAFKFVADAWGTLSDSVRKSQFDWLVSPFVPVDLVRGPQTHTYTQSQYSQSRGVEVNFGNSQTQNQQQVRRGDSEALRNQTGNGNVNGNVSASFWTTCPYCYVLYEYPRVYEGFCLRCQRCERAFQGVEIPALPPLVPGKEEYHCCWAHFPIGFKSSGSGNMFPNWVPQMFNSVTNGGDVNGNVRPQPVQQNSMPPLQRQGTQVQQVTPVRMGVDMSFGVRSADNAGKKKRGRPRKYVM